jgi:hypothetical protein
LKKKKNFVAAVADYPATAEQKFLLLFSKRSLSLPPPAPRFPERIHDLGRYH